MNNKDLVRQGIGPLLAPDHMPCEANAVMNPGVAEIDGDAALFPGNINGRFYMLHRPGIGGEEDIWYSSSTHNLTH